MSKYLVSLGIVWVAIALIIGIVLVVTAPDKDNREMMEHTRQTSRASMAPRPEVKDNTQVNTELYVEGTRATGENNVDTFVHVVE